MLADLEKKVQSFIEKYHMIKKGGRVLAGVSGGADSVCLLLVMHKLEKELGFSLAAVHVEHGIRGVESLADAVFTESLCAGLGVPFRKFSVDALGHSLRTRQSVEEAARELRYGCFARACAEFCADGVAVAHHANDNAETMLFHLARGTGIRGLAGIPPVTDNHADRTIGGMLPTARGIFPVADNYATVGGRRMRVFRPLLCATRAEIEEYLDACGQTYCMDSTNADLKYARNRVRGQVLPELTGINAQAVAHMGKTAGWLREICEYLDEAALGAGAGAYEVVYGKVSGQTDGAPIAKIRIFSEQFSKMHRVLQSTLAHKLLGLIAGSEKDIASGHVEQVLALFVMRIGKRTDLPYGISARRTGDGVELYHRADCPGTPGDGVELCHRADCPGMPGDDRVGGPGGENGRMEKKTDENLPAGAGVPMDLPVPGALALENGGCLRAEIMEFDGNFEKIPKKRYTKWMDYDKIKNTVQLRTRRPGDYLQIDASGGRKKLKRYFIDEKIPEEERGRTLLAADGSHILWVIGHRISEACKVTSGTRRVLCLEYQTSDRAEACQETQPGISRQNEDTEDNDGREN